MRSTFVTGSICLASLAFVAAPGTGCTAGTISVIGGDGGTWTSTNDQTGTDSGGEPDSSASEDSATTQKDSAPPDPEQACHSQPGTACKSCCDNEHATGKAARDNSLKSCACGASYCSNDCYYTYCADPASPPDTYCQECLDLYASAGSSCAKQADTACASDSDCAAMLKCESGCNGGSDDAGASADAAVDYTTTPECDAFCAKLQSTCHQTCTRSVDCAQKTGQCANYTRQYLQCEVDTGQWYCSSGGGYSLVSQCDSVCQ
jgi:hypothetical protein